MLQRSRTYQDSFPRLEVFLAAPWQATIEAYADSLQGMLDRPVLVTFLQEHFGLSIAQAAQYQVGFSDRSLGAEVPSNRVKLGQEIRHLLTQLGIYKDNGRETLRGYLTIPLWDEAGMISGIEGWRLDAKNKTPQRLVIGTGCSKLERRDQASGVRLQAEEVLQDASPVSQPATSEVSSTCEPTPASSLSPPANSASDVSFTVESESVLITRGDRSYRIRGLDRNMSSLSLKVNITAARADLIHVDTVDLMKAQSRSSFQRAAAVELYCEEDTIKRDLGQVLLHIEELRNRQIEAAKGITKPVELSPQEQQQALDLLTDPQLISRIISDLDQCGMVGEPFNKLAAYLAATSRLLDKPLAILVRSNSAAGKTTLMDSILHLMPPEQQLRLSNLTSQSLYYLPAGSIAHKILAISEDQGISEAAYALKLLQSEGKLTHATVGKNAQGHFQMQTHEVEGPVQLFLTSTRMQLDEELVNRCFVLTVDESSQHTLAIQERQRQLETRAGKASLEQTQQIRGLHRNAQRLIRPMEVDNPLAETMQFPCSRTRNRRDHEKFLTLIRTIALLHQHQRPVICDEAGVERIEVVQTDIDLANRLVERILKLSMDELTPQTQNCLTLLQQLVEAIAKRDGVRNCEVRFTRRMLRESIQWSDYQVSTHLDRLVSLEYVRAHRGRQGATYVYELLE